MDSSSTNARLEGLEHTCKGAVGVQDLVGQVCIVAVSGARWVCCRAQRSFELAFFFFGRRHLPFGWSPTLRLTCGPAGNRNTTGSLSAMSKDTALPTSPQGRLREALNLQYPVVIVNQDQAIRSRRLFHLLQQSFSGSPGLTMW